jgi:hypothetical protein
VQDLIRIAIQSTSYRARAQRRSRAATLFRFGWLPLEKPCRDTEKKKNQNNENNYLPVNVTAQ